jgi:UTP--glucose-1-phosphate uridylyltransferase
MQTKKIRKVVFPVAGLGTRFLPASKAVPKEMLPIVDKPLLQYAVEEAVAAGITEMIFVTSSGKKAIEDHFDVNYELEAKLTQGGKKDLLKVLHDIAPNGVSFVAVRQGNPLGLGHAVLCAKEIVGDEPFAVILPDDLIYSTPKSCLQQMVELYEETQNSVLAIQKVAQEETEKYGIVSISDDILKSPAINAIVEKPKAALAPSNLAVVGRYILTPRVFELLKNTRHGAIGEIQLTDGIAALAKEEAVRAYLFDGRRYDCGSKFGYLEATVAYGLKNPEIAKEFKEYLRRVVAEQ